MAQSETLQ